jgi:hypothetical protein
VGRETAHRKGAKRGAILPLTPTGVRFGAFQCASVRDPEYDCPVFDLG